MSKVFQEDLDFELDLKELGYNLRIIIYCLKYSAVEFKTMKILILRAWIMGSCFPGVSPVHPGQHHEHIRDSGIRG